MTEKEIHVLENEGGLTMDQDNSLDSWNDLEWGNPDSVEETQVQMNEDLKVSAEAVSEAVAETEEGDNADEVGESDVLAPTQETGPTANDEEVVGEFPFLGMDGKFAGRVEFFKDTSFFDVVAPDGRRLSDRLSEGQEIRFLDVPKR